MNTIGIALVWCVVQVTLIGVLAAGLYLVVRRLRPAAAASVVFTSLAIVVVLSLMAVSPWPRWTIHQSSPRQLGEGPELNATGPDTVPFPADVQSLPGEGHEIPVAGNEPVPPKSQPSVVALLWQALLDELANPQPAVSANATWQWPAAVAVLLLTTMAFGLMWLLLGVLTVRRQRLRSRPVLDRELLELVDILRAELACRRPVEVRQSDDLVTAATVGWRRPLLLLPTDWKSWTADQRRAVLAHEIAHARSHDFLALLFGQLGLVLHFYHPLLHWLMNRLRLEQELAADAAAASISGGQWKYLTTIAELALHQQDRPLLWPARAFLPTQTTFLRRIAMLRNSKLRFYQVSLAVRLTAIGAVLLCGLLVAGIRGPSARGAALADKVSKADGADDSIDANYMIEKASLIVAVRPAAIFAQSDLTALTKLLEQPLKVLLKEKRLTDFRQITMIVPDVGIISGLREIVVLQSIKPTDEAYIKRHLVDERYTAKEYHGKQMYVRPGGGRAFLQLDDHTVIQTGSEQAMAAYLAGNLGVLPKWLPAKAWDSFKNDHFTITANTAMMRREIEALTKHSPPIVQAAFASIAPVWQDTTALIAGAKLDDRLAVHAWAATSSAESSEKLQRTAEALKTLAQSAVKNTRTTIQSSGHPDRATILPILDLADGLLENVKSQQAENQVRVETSVVFDKAQLAALLPPIARAREAAHRSQAMNNMKMIALAMLNYEQANRRFPPAVLYGPDGKTPYSWRVALLPYLEGGELYKQYRFDESWDGPNNRKLLEKMPAVFRSPNESVESRNSAYFVLTGQGTIFDGKKGTEIKDIVDGMSNTILAVEAKRDIPWTKPEDIPYDPDKPLPKLGGYFEGGFITAMADGSVHFSSAANEKTLRLLITKADRQPVRMDEVLRPVPQRTVPTVRPSALAPQMDQEAARKTASMNNMKQLALGLLVYENANRSFPPAYKADKNGKPLLSWRVLVLPYLEESKLHEQFHLDEPWDSDHNKTLVARMPRVFLSPQGVVGNGKTNYLTVRNPHSAFPGEQGIHISNVVDGTSNTIALVEVNNEQAVIWTKPDDFQYDPTKPALGLGGLWREGFLAAIADGSVRMIPATIRPKALDALFTRDGREPIDWRELVAKFDPGVIQASTAIGVMDTFTGSDQSKFDTAAIDDMDRSIRREPRSRSIDLRHGSFGPWASPHHKSAA